MYNPLGCRIADCSSRACSKHFVTMGTALGMNHEDPSGICNKRSCISVHLDTRSPKGLPKGSKISAVTHELVSVPRVISTEFLYKSVREEVGAGSGSAIEI